MKNIMKKLGFFLLILYCFFTTGCLSIIASIISSQPSVVQLDPIEIFGKKGESLQGKLFLSSLETDAYGNASATRNAAITGAAKKAKELGYPYFTVIWDNLDTNTISGSYDTTQYVTRTQQSVQTHQYNYTVFKYECMFIMLNSNELNGWDNIYTVSRYI